VELQGPIFRARIYAPPSADCRIETRDGVTPTLEELDALGILGQLAGREKDEIYAILGMLLSVPWILFYEVCLDGGITLRDGYPKDKPKFRPWKVKPSVVPTTGELNDLPEDWTKAPPPPPGYVGFWMPELPEWPEGTSYNPQDHPQDPIPMEVGVVVPGRIDVAGKIVDGKQPFNAQVYWWMLTNGYQPKSAEMTYVLNSQANFHQDLRTYDLIITMAYVPQTGKYVIVSTTEREDWDAIGGIPNPSDLLTLPVPQFP
jgi:hypothetical protein